MSPSTPTSFKAAIITSPKAKNTLTTRSLPDLAQDQVVIKITAAAINPVDWKMQEYDNFLPSYPAIIGSDAAGTIVSLGSSVTEFSIGDRVFFQGIFGNNDSSTFQQYCIMPSSLIAKTPSNMKDEQVAGVSLALMAVVTAFYDKTGYGLAAPWSPKGSEAGKGKAIVITGGSSSVGQYAIQLARLSGFSKIVTNASPANHEHLKTLGATAVLDRSHSAAEDFKKVVGDTELEFVFDAISASATQKLGVAIVQAVEKRGEGACVVTVHTVHPEEVDPEAVKLGKEGSVKVDVKQVLGIGSSKELRYLSEPLMKALGGEEGWIATTEFMPMKVRVVEGGLGAVEEALQLNKKGVSGEKVVIRPWDT